MARPRSSKTVSHRNDSEGPKEPSTLVKLLDFSRSYLGDGVCHICKAEHKELRLKNDYWYCEKHYG